MSEKFMRRKARTGLIVAVVASVAGVLTAGALVLGGVLPVAGGVTHPPCEQLPTAAEAHRALDGNPELAEELHQAGPGVTVTVDSPGCENADQALIDVTYSSNDERDRIDEVLTEGNGFGVPVYVHEA
ncbi:hypothetical protein CKW39_01000 [Kocuria sp. WRN011]|uniref:hypothetical protein n=1 Tax=Kocuria sp. WRN011 TaxID=2029858 RepID=UPI000BAF7154|nr:hypothetical protein [Kocuria sp. WRN011]PBB09691.1 hypothetical protein CKW39_01000 [Kocuria sp. WRN011]